MKYFALMTLIVLVSCGKKDNIDENPNGIVQPKSDTLSVELINGNLRIVIDTFHPLEYLPVFPGSYWKYADNNNDTITSTTSLNFLPDSFSANRTTWVNTISWVPFLDGMGIWGYGRNDCGVHINGGCELTQLLNVQIPVGSVWLTEYFSPGPHLTKTYREIMTMDTSLLINSVVYDSVVKIKEYVEYLYSNDPPPRVTFEYYSKNVGLVKLIEYNNWDSSVYEKNIIDYFINK